MVSQQVWNMQHSEAQKKFTREASYVYTKRVNFEFCSDKRGEILDFDPTKKGEILSFDRFNPVTSCSQNFLSFRTLILAYPKLVGAPCTRTHLFGTA